MVRLIAALALTALALPAQAQRLDTRVFNVQTRDGTTTCDLNANQYVRLDQGKAAAAGYFRPVELRPGFVVAFEMRFSPGGAMAIDLGFTPTGDPERPPVRSVRLLIDGVDSGVQLSLAYNMDHSERGLATIPEPDRATTAKRILAARWIEFEVDEGGDSPTTWHYRFDALRIRDVAEILSIIHYSCTGGRAD